MSIHFQKDIKIFQYFKSRPFLKLHYLSFNSFYEFQLLLLNKKWFIFNIFSKFSTNFRTFSLFIKPYSAVMFWLSIFMTPFFYLPIGAKTVFPESSFRQFLKALIGYFFKKKIRLNLVWFPSYFQVIFQENVSFFCWE